MKKKSLEKVFKILLLHAFIVGFLSPVSGNWKDIFVSKKYTRITDIDFGYNSKYFVFDTIYVSNFNFYDGGYLTYSYDSGKTWGSIRLNDYSLYYVLPYSILRVNDIILVGGWSSNAAIFVFDKSLNFRNNIIFDPSFEFPNIGNINDMIALSDSLVLACGYEGKVLAINPYTLEFKNIGNNLPITFNKMKVFSPNDSIFFIYFFASGDYLDPSRKLYFYKFPKDSLIELFNFRDIDPTIDVFDLVILDKEFESNDIPDTIIVSASNSENIILLRSIDSGVAWEVLFQYPSYDDLLGIHLTKTNEIVGVTDSGNIFSFNLLTNQFQWLETHQKKKFFGVKFYEKNFADSNYLVSELLIVGYGLDDLISFYRFQTTLGDIKQFESTEELLPEDNVVVFDIFGRRIFEGTFQKFNALFYNILADGVYFAVCPKRNVTKKIVKIF